MTQEFSRPWLTKDFPAKCGVVFTNNAKAILGNIQLSKGAAITGISFGNEENKLDKKFKAGDKVVRTKLYNVGGDFGFMQKGMECVVKSMPSQFLLEVEGSGIHYDIDCFELVEDKPTFNNMKFRVNSPEQSKEIQEALFSMGYKWECYGKQVKFADGDLWDWLFTDKSGILYRGIDVEVENHRVLDGCEYTIKTTKTYDLILVENVKTEVEIPEELPMEDIVELMGQKYFKKELFEALKFYHEYLDRHRYEM
jgi:hypothetical protein